jgi:Baseplate J-like protein
VGLTFADLMTAESVATIRARLAANLATAGAPVASWAPSSAGGAENLRLDAVAGAMQQLMAQRIANIVNGRILSLASDPPGGPPFLTYLGKKFYKLDKRDATSTIQNVALYVPAGVSVNYTFNPGDLWVRSNNSGHRYRSITGGSLNGQNTFPNVASGRVTVGVDNPLMLQFQAENPGSAYDDKAGDITTMVTAKAGVRCVNVAPSDFMPSPARCNGTSTGTVTPYLALPAPAPASIRIQIVTTGDVGHATFKWSFDGGLTWNGAIVMAPIITLSASNGVSAQVQFADNASAGAVSSFIAGDIFTALLGSAILQQGNDAETDAAFRQRCRNRWPALSLVPTAAVVNLWAHEASPEIARVFADADPNTPGGMLVTVASSAGTASPAAVSAVEDYIVPRLLGYQGVAAASGFSSPAETVRVSSALPFNVKTGGVVQVPRAQLAAAQLAWVNAWNEYLIGLPIGGQPGAVVEMAVLEQTLADSGAVEASGLTLNGGSVDITVTNQQVAVASTSTITWQPI